MSILMVKIIQILIFFFLGITVSIMTNGLILHFAQTLGIRNKNDVIIRWSNESKPSLGGISFFVVFMFSIFAFAIFYADANIFRNHEFLGLLAGSVVAFFMGMADDAYNTRPMLKLSMQILSGVILVLFDTIIQITPYYSINALFTILWVVGIMNSLNMLDNMDGITATVVVGILTSCLFISFITLDINTNFWTIILVTQVGGLIGFLKYNIHPSKMFMGDTGSQFIGLFVSFFSIKGLWNSTSILELAGWKAIVITLVAFTPAIVDTLTVTINRIKAGKSPMVGGKDHTTHHMVYKGKTDYQVWFNFLLLSICSSALSILLITLIDVNIYLSWGVGLTYFLIVFARLYSNTQRFKAPSK
ncbi:UDP-GlcNAc:undecaprenyl-phosphate GlcNAc-1-phosphate transferase [Lishizhenia tianjinensis]|uniref:UDP-GlcNAc:undecaprenyl-phosphate GlcNAc-1-phosphate transferase n=1 Tax=Lishizhenia tianjinensis TaxID=477690 RepID=A0A1I7BMB8_9FLAO|nr:MraY family glycosyltransferase [Lishizhenia tianjinensis]SFT88328.1 UDP-GlcNAc:undecaprenyl-phosphate GlcNAc-1-phosphate transferase [Lishizhenia tianjinensis]